MRELTALYTAFATGRPSPLPEPTLQYIDFSEWQRERLQGKLLDDLLGFWRRGLAGSPRLEMPTDRPRPPVQRFNGALRYSVIPRPLLDRLQAFSQAEEVSLFMTLLAAFDALLHRWTGQEDVVVGSPIANRNQKQVEELMGFFVNMLALRLRLDGSLTFRELVGRAREVTMEAFAHQDLPFELLVRELSVPRDMSLHPLFQVSLVLQNSPLPPLELPGLSVSLVEVDWGTTAYDLAFFFWETALWENLEEGLSLIVSYSTDLYDTATVARLTGHLEHLLAAAMDDPDARLRDLEILAPAERHQLLVEWSGAPDVPAMPVPAEPLHRLVEARAARHPGAPAADFAGETVTAAELCRLAHRMAHRLRRLGVSPEVPVAVILPPSLDLIVASLAVLEAGGVCVPVDPELPPERIERLLEVSHATAVVTRETLEAAAGESAEPLRLPVDPDSLAYLLFTSGSTGVPKAVGLTHRAVARMASADPAGPASLSPEDRVALAANPSFDASLWEIWAPLLAGACLVGLEREALLTPRSLGSALAQRRLSALFVPTALLHTVAGEAPAAFCNLRLLLFGGEMADPAALRAVLAHGRPERLVHLYGPAEATTYATLQEVTHLPPRAAAVPVGRPAPGRRIHLLDAALAPVPLGVEGEVWIGGEGLARGYCGTADAPGLTAERFLPDPFSGTPGARLYRTGDRARLQADGALEIRGRTDEQIKVRGFRIEPAEVRAAMTRHPGVREAAVADREGRLEAYAVPRPGTRLEPGELLADLRRRLPPWMVPSRLAVVAALPRTAAGKVDLGSLPEIPARPTAGPAPRTPVEQTLAGIWQDVLGCSVTNVQDDFFDLGGQSLDAVRVTSRAAGIFGVDLTVRTLYEAPTVEAFAARLGAK